MEIGSRDMWASSVSFEGEFSSDLVAERLTASVSIGRRF